MTSTPLVSQHRTSHDRPHMDKRNTGTSDATMAVFLDLENLVLGARDAKYPGFDIQKVLERLLLKGHIVVKKAYCDYDRYKDFKRGLHEAAFELIEIPHVRQSGKNSADIRMVVDALDLCYTKGHVDTFVIVSGDSDFSPLVSKLRENAKTVIGVGVKNSTSDLFINNCDEFIYYDDLVRKEPAKSRRKAATTTPNNTPAQPKTDKAPNKGPDATQALDQLVETLDAITEEREENDPIWGSMIKQAIKRRNPGFNERAHGFGSFNDLLVEAQKRGLIKLQPDEKSGGYTVRLTDKATAATGNK
ncbi:MAG: NYN domain-containing protein [Steroidobacteraceae bacterium]